MLVVGWQYRGPVAIRMPYLMFVRLTGWLALLMPKTPSVLVGAVVRMRANVVRDSARAMGVTLWHGDGPC
jgi:hypothetical protein